MYSDTPGVLDAFERWQREPVDHPVLSVVVPAYNERDRIVPTIGAIAAHVCDGRPWELLVSDDGSSDDTVDRVHRLGLANVRVLSAEANTGKGDAVRRGMLAARGDRVLFADADQSTPIEELDRLMAALDEGFDVAVGSRAADGATEANRSAARRLVSATSRALIRRAMRLDLSDTQCGFKLFTRAAAQRLFAAQTIEGFSFDLEVLYLAARLGMEVAEVPVEWIDAPGSKVDTSREVVRFLRDLRVIRRNDAQGVYAHA